jgi:protein-S-isoprenylcysteine O-methyltransferase Ste14
MIVLGFMFSVASYLGFLLTFTYFALFSAGVGVPKSVDTGAPGSLGSALAIDVGLLLLFGVQHSVMARSGFKRVLTRVVPERLERAIFVLASSAALAVVMWGWRPWPSVIWSVDDPTAAGCLWAINALGWVGVPLCSFMIDHFDLFGLAQAWQGFRRQSVQRGGFVTPLLYRHVRHPMMTSLLVAFWLTPHMTVGHLILSLGMSAYILVGVHFEERSLARELGLAYVRYQASTPRFLPGRSPVRLNDGSTSEPISGRAL